MKVYKESIELIRLIGKDVTDFLQRVSSNDFRKFDSNFALRSVFVSDKGRIVDLVSVLNIDDMFVLVPSVGRERKTADFLNKYIVSEDIEIIFDKCVKYTLIPECESDNEFLSGCNFVEGNYFYTDEYRFKKLMVIALNDESDFTQVLLEHTVLMTAEEFKNFAIEKAFLYDSNELNDEINPLECGLKEYISFTKGCYIGQERLRN
jgi:folate-binding protein YgfZ